MPNPERRSDQQKARGDYGRSRKRAHAERGELRSVATEYDRSRDQNDDGDDRFQHLKRQHPRHHSYTTRSLFFCRGNRYTCYITLIPMSFWPKRALHIPMFVSTEQAVEWGSHLNAKQHATLVKKQRALSSRALGEYDLQRMVGLATQSQLMREAAEAFVPA